MLNKVVVPEKIGAIKHLFCNCIKSIIAQEKGKINNFTVIIQNKQLLWTQTIKNHSLQQKTVQRNRGEKSQL